MNLIFESPVHPSPLVRGEWIEMLSSPFLLNVPDWSPLVRGEWIEIQCQELPESTEKVSPRERGVD